MSSGTPLDPYGPLNKRWDPSGSYGELYLPQDPPGHLFVPSDLRGYLGITFIYWYSPYFPSLWIPLDPLVALWNYWVPLHPLDPSIIIALDPISSIKVLLDPSLPSRTLLNQLGPLWIP